MSFPVKFSDEEHIGQWVGVYFIVLQSAPSPLLVVRIMNEVRASQLAQASERVGSLIPASQQG